MDRHLVAVKVGVECGTYQRMELNSPALDEHGFECLNAQSVKRGRTVQQYGMVTDDLFEYIPNLRFNALYLALRRLDVGSGLLLDQLLHNEGLKQLERHLLGQTALIHLQLGADNDNGTAGIVNTLSKQVLTETSLLAAKHLRKGFERAVAGAGHGAATPAVVDKSVNSFLEHALFVPDDNIRRAILYQLDESLIPVDNAPVKVVKVAGCEPAAVELYHRAQIGGDDRDHVENHPFGLVAALDECFNDLKTLDSICALLAGAGIYILTQLLGESVKVEILEQFLDSLCAHAYAECV